MKIQFAMLIGILAVAVASFVPSDSLGQADPYWLSSWNEARAMFRHAMLLSEN